MDGKDDFEEWRKAFKEAVKAAYEKGEKKKSKETKKMEMEKWLWTLSQVIFAIVTTHHFYRPFRVTFIPAAFLCNCFCNVE